MNTEQERNKLLPCPFCGSTNIEIQIRTPGREGVPTNLMCSDCGASGPWEYEQDNSHAKVDAAWNRRAALQSQSMSPEISRDLLGKIVDEVFDGAIEDASVIEDIYRVVARECALQPQYMEDAKRWRALKERSIATFMDNYGRTLMIATVEVDRFPNQITMEGIIDHARRAEGGGG